MVAELESCVVEGEKGEEEVECCPVGACTGEGRRKDGSALSCLKAMEKVKSEGRRSKGWQKRRNVEGVQSRRWWIEFRRGKSLLVTSSLPPRRSIARV